MKTPLYHQPGHLPPEIVDLQRDLHGRRTSEAMAAKARRGIMPGCAPLGYSNVCVNGEKTIVPDSSTAQLICEAFSLSAEGMPLRKALMCVTEKGLRSRNGKKMGVSAFAGILKNPFYCGMLSVYGESLRGTHEPLISKTLFRRVQRGLKSRRCS